MNITICSGKGGVGKTTSAVSIAMKYAQSETVAIIEYDAGHSIKRTLGITDRNIPDNKMTRIDDRLFLGIIANMRFNGIEYCKETLGKEFFKEYMEQFPSDRGILAFSNIVNEFFGVPTDSDTVQKFALLVTLLHECKEAGVEHVIIDVEPTAGFQQLLSCSTSMVRSLRNLNKKSMFIKKAVQIGWPDVYQFLESAYIKDIDVYTSRITHTASLLMSARYILVCIPEESPVQQTFDVRKIIEDFGGTVHGYIVNNIRHAPHETKHLHLIRNQQLPVAEIMRREELHEDSTDKRFVLFAIGSEIEEVFPSKKPAAVAQEDPLC
jgi:anion-transporting  ArsA/GET3 family ATPase